MLGDGGDRGQALLLGPGPGRLRDFPLRVFEIEGPWAVIFSDVHFECPFVASYTAASPLARLLPLLKAARSVSLVLTIEH